MKNQHPNFWSTPTDDVVFFNIAKLPSTAYTWRLSNVLCHCHIETSPILDLLVVTRISHAILIQQLIQDSCAKPLKPNDVQHSHQILDT